MVKAPGRSGVGGSTPALPLERILQSQGFGSRKQCRALVRQGQVSVGGDPVLDPFQTFPLDDFRFEVGTETWTYREKAYLALHKPAGYECSRNPRHHPGVLSLLPSPLVTRGVQPVGRLDEDTTGLLLLTDDGDFIHHLISPRRKVAKVYRVTTKHPIGDDQLQRLRAGVVLHESPEPVTAIDCQKVSEHLLLMTLGEGKYHQVKRMVAAAGNRVIALERIRIGTLALGDDLAPGQWTWLDPRVVEELRGIPVAQP